MAIPDICHICPFTRSDQRGSHHCRHECMWWMKDEQECAVKYIAYLMKARTGEEVQE